MVPPKSKNTAGLGNSLMNDRFGRGRGADQKRVSAIQRTGPGGEQYVTNDKEAASWVKLRSVTGQSALDEFLSTAELAGTDFTADKPNRNTRIIHPDQRDPFLPTEGEQRAAARRQAAHRARLAVPRRPPWTKQTTRAQLEARERESFLEWRRGLADLAENHDLLLTPFERNLEVWRQLWRVVERSDLLVQIVDARDPLLFRSEDLERYVKEVDPAKRNLLLVNKADLLTKRQRKAWARYFDREGINFRFFSAHDARESQADADEAARSDPTEGVAQEVGKLEIQEADSETPDEHSERESGSSNSRILTLDELEALFMSNIPELPVQEPSEASEASEAQPPQATSEPPQQRQATVGLVGYPNVGKSSTINALLGAKKVSVSATPGKTKHFQTLRLSEAIVLCDCPGLALPNFAASAAALVCAGVLPVDQQRELRGPAALVARRIPRATLEAAYGVRIPVRPADEGGSGVPTASELLSAYARARGFAASGSGGQPDESRAARYVLKDYVAGRLPFCHPPPADPPIDAREFNAELHQDFRSTRKMRSLAGDDASAPSTTADEDGRPVTGAKSRQLDKKFFRPQVSKGGHTSTPFGYVERGGGKQLSGRKQKLVIAMERGIDPSEVRLENDKKHFKGRRPRGTSKETGADYE